MVKSWIGKITDPMKTALQEGLRKHPEIADPGVPMVPMDWFR